MTKSQKQKTNVKKEKSPTAGKERKDEHFLESAANGAVSGKTVVDSDIDHSKTGSVRPETSEIKVDDFADVSEERASIVSIVKALEGQVEVAFQLKEVLETELDATQIKLSEQLDARAQLEAQVKSLEAQAALVEQLREDIAFVEEERNKFANQLAQIQPQFKSLTDERDRLAGQVTSAEECTKDLKAENMALEAQVMNLKDKITDTDRLHRELADLTEAGRNMREQAHNLSKRLGASEESKDAIETELAATRQTMRSLREEIETLRKKIASADSRSADMRIQLEEQQAANRDLLQAKAQLENEIKMLGIKYEAAKKELDAFKNALRDIRSEASLTSGRVRQKYFKLSNPGISDHKTGINLSQNHPQPLSPKT